jgi:phosphoglycolate phosphatase
LTPPGELKPNPKVLLDIIASVDAKPIETVYVGDSLMKDVAMAQQAGVTDVWAKYGVAQDRAEYELLRAVTHWQQSGVESEKVFIPPKSPQFVLEQSFSELLTFFSFARSKRPGVPNDHPPPRRFPDARNGV